MLPHAIMPVAVVNSGLLKIISSMYSPQFTHYVQLYTALCKFMTSGLDAFPFRCLAMHTVYREN